jgi:hypothetical protein
MLSDDASDCLLPNPETEESKREDDDATKFRNESFRRKSVPGGRSPKFDSVVEDVMASLMADSGTGSSSGGDACHRSKGVIAIHWLVGTGEPARLS